MRIASFLLVLLAAFVLTATAHAGEPTSTPEPTGSISGRFVVEGQPGVPYSNVCALASALPQPIDLRLTHVLQTDDQGSFTFTGLEDGDYFILPFMGWEVVEPPGEDVVFHFQGPEGGEGTITLSGLRVTVANGESVTGIEIVVRGPGREPPPPPPPDQLSPPSQMTEPAGLPPTGTGPGGVGAIAAYIGLAMAALAVLLLAAGAAMRLRAGRPS